MAQFYFSHLPPNLSAFQGGLSEDEAFQRALQQSLQDADGETTILVF
jgi:hypothetical protein